ncbi:phosphatase PAP2 family protein [Spiroplasma tabanidicola]|uniref:Phosphatase PAP2 family protein n=1 Tax=Spiroplasma tabanidicola TaxID=324079 RepID=A0A6I6C5A7_9MOLU|nr:phosphatase PAP2 family protein [Spiroplasma tabanidicola]QGS52027.1 phosphatase PAP2 family protein [Spiroplasma tabanidicola]
MIFSKSNAQVRIFKYALAVWFTISLIQFVAATFFDQEINKFFGELMEYRWIRIFAWIFENSGDMAQPVLFYFVIFTIFFESIYVYCKKNNKFHIWIWIYYIFIFLTWIYVHVKNYFSFVGIDDGFGPDISAWFFESYEICRYIVIALAIVDTIILLAFFYYLRFKFVKRKDVIENAYWLKSLKTFISAAGLTLIVWVLKLTFLRPYYYQTDFDNILNNENLVKQEWKDYYLNEGHNIMKWGKGLLGNYGSKFVPWFEITDFPNGWKNFISGERGDPGYNFLYADFPSGHMASTYSVFYALVFFYDKKLHQNYTKRYIALFCFWMFYLNLVLSTQLITKTHWLSDLSFTNVLGVLWPLGLYKIINKIVFKIICKKISKNNIQVKGLVIIRNKSYHLMVIHNGNVYDLASAGIFFPVIGKVNKKIEILMKKYYIKEIKTVESKE